ncbi:galactose mutarotase-like domain-containing protein [Pilobolus umbonatus]|nr:galactose mutarotase-like domain-containing protein [Pilobolus umbonatus]
MSKGGKAGECDCGTPGLWNENWFPNTVTVPSLIGNVCLLLLDKLSAHQLSECARIQKRGFDRVLNPPPHATVITGANIADIASIGVTYGLQVNDSTIVQQAIDILYGSVFINEVVGADGIQADGSFMQHKGILYTGNYGKDYINELLHLFIETKNTSLVPTLEVEQVFTTLLAGTEWMIMADIHSTKTNKLMWQYSSIGRMVSNKYSQGQGSGGVKINLEMISDASDHWTEEPRVDSITDRLTDTATSANQGNLIGTRYFYSADYLVHRAPNYITALKMYSNRTTNSECVNLQNPYGFHLSDGNIYTYVDGDEYIDVSGAWDWEYIPGTTVDYGGTVLKCSHDVNGISPFVGGATDLNNGIAVFDFVNPVNQNLRFQKTFFFFPEGYAVQIGPTESKNLDAPLRTILDQRRRRGDIYVNGARKNTNTTYTTTTRSIWHDRVGYYFPTNESLFVHSQFKTANWSDIGVSVGNETQQLFGANIRHTITNTTGLLTQYIVQPGISHTQFHDNINTNNLPISLDFRASDPQINAAYSATQDMISIAFWTPGTYVTPWKNTTITSDTPCVLLFRETFPDTYRLTVSNPTQLASSSVIKLKLKVGAITKTVTYNFPTDNLAGKHMVKTVIFA